MQKEVRDALAEALGLMHLGLNTFGKPLSADLVGVYIMALEKTKCDAEAVQAAAVWFLQDSDGDFPTAPEFRRQVEEGMRRRVVSICVETTRGLALVDVPRSLPEDERLGVARRIAQSRGLELAGVQISAIEGGE